MTSVTVWLMVMVGTVSAGGVTVVAPQLFPTEAACMKLIKPVTTPRYGAMFCIQTEVVK